MMATVRSGTSRKKKAVSRRVRRDRGRRKTSLMTRESDSSVVVSSAEEMSDESSLRSAVGHSDTDSESWH